MNLNITHITILVTSLFINTHTAHADTSKFANYLHESKSDRSLFFQCQDIEGPCKNFRLMHGQNGISIPLLSEKNTEIILSDEYVLTTLLSDFDSFETTLKKREHAALVFKLRQLWGRNSKPVEVSVHEYQTSVSFFVWLTREWEKQAQAIIASEQAKMVAENNHKLAVEKRRQHHEWLENNTYQIFDVTPQSFYTILSDSSRNSAPFTGSLLMKVKFRGKVYSWARLQCGKGELAPTNIYFSRYYSDKNWFAYNEQQQDTLEIFDFPDQEKKIKEEAEGKNVVGKFMIYYRNGFDGNETCKSIAQYLLTHKTAYFTAKYDPDATPSWPIGELKSFEGVF